MSTAQISTRLRRDGWPGHWSGYMTVKLSDGRRFRGMSTDRAQVYTDAKTDTLREMNTLAGNLRASGWEVTTRFTEPKTI